MNRTYYLDDWLVEPNLDRVSRNGVDVSLRPQVMDLLVYFIQRPREIISTDEILTALWAGKVTTPASVYNCMKELRHALEDDPHEPRYIETISKRGYRLLAPVKAVGDRNLPAQPEASPGFFFRRADRKSLGRFSRQQLTITLIVLLSAVLGLVTAAALLWLNSSPYQPNALVAERPWVLITDFDNRSGETRFDGTVEMALRSELANSRHVLVVAPERIRDTLVLMKREPGVTIDAALGREICLRYEENCALLTGRVEKFDSNYLFSLELVDPADGRTVASAAEEADGEAEVLPAIHRLTNWLRRNLGEELAQISRDDERFEKVTTPSLRALELYSRGMKVALHNRWAEAEALFRQAVVEDPEFASAILFVFWALENQEKGLEKEAQSFLKRAMDLVDSVSEQERYFIEGTYYWLLVRDYEKACGSFKTLAELFPDHYWAAGNTSIVCGWILGHREDSVRYIIQAAEQRPVYWSPMAAAALTLIEGDFNRAQTYVARLKGLIAVEDNLNFPVPYAVAFTELFLAEEYLDKGLLVDVVSELQRVELALGSMDGLRRERIVWMLGQFYLALGQFQKAEALCRGLYYHELYGSRLCQSWRAFLVGDQAAFREHVAEFRVELREELPDPAERLIFVLQWSMWPLFDYFPLDALIPLYEPESAVAMATATGEPFPHFLSWPKFQAKLQLAQGKQLLNQGRPDEAIKLLRDGVAWFRDNGGWETFPYYFLGAEFLAVALAGQGDLPAAYRVLVDAAGQRNLVNSYTAPLHQKIQARQALLARELGRAAEAEAIEAELAEELKLADADHPILVQIREQQKVLLEIE